MRKVPAAAARTAAEFGVTLVPARSFSEYAGNAETRLAEPSSHPHDEDFIVQTRSGLDVWVLTRSSDGWNAQRVNGHDCGRVIKSAHIPHDAKTLPAILRAVFE